MGGQFAQTCRRERTPVSGKPWCNLMIRARVVLRRKVISDCHTCVSNRSGFQMTIESSYSMAIATLTDWLKSLAPVFQPMRGKIKTNRILYARFFPRFD